MEQVSKTMMNELDLAGKVSDPTDLEKIISDHNFSIDTPEIMKWYNPNDMPEALVPDHREKQIKLMEHIWGNEPQFEEEKPKKWVVRAPDTVSGNGITLEWYLCRNDWNPSDPYSVHGMGKGADKKYKDKVIVKFDTKEEAMEYVNPQTEAVEVEE